MPEKTKRNKEFEKPAEKKPAEPDAATTKDTWSEDQQKKSYYYDDSYGYEVYHPEQDENDEQS